MKSKSNFCKYNFILTAKLLFILGLITSFAFCTKEPAYKEYLIQVDSLAISYPQTLLYSGLFEINVYGTISSNGCSSFSHFNISRQNQDVIIEAWKNVQVNATVCPTVMVYLNHKIFCNRDSLPENFTIKVRQPDGSYLEKTMK
jgi:hypothetical protein